MIIARLDSAELKACWIKSIGLTSLSACPFISSGNVLPVEATFVFACPSNLVYLTLYIIVLSGGTSGCKGKGVDKHRAQSV